MHIAAGALSWPSRRCGADTAAKRTSGRHPVAVQGVQGGRGPSRHRLTAFHHREEQCLSRDDGSGQMLYG
jgi:hypothetical protein